MTTAEMNDVVNQAKDCIRKYDEAAKAVEEAWSNYHSHALNLSLLSEVAYAIERLRAIRERRLA